MSDNPATNSALRRTLSELVIAVLAREQNPDKLASALETARKALLSPAVKSPPPETLYIEFGTHLGQRTVKLWHTEPFADGVQYTRTGK